MFFTIACLAASIAFAGKSAQELWDESAGLKGDALAAWESSLTSDDVRTLADDVLAAASTNWSAVLRRRANLCARRIFQHWGNGAYTELAGEYDVKFANANIFFNCLFPKYAPKTSAKWLDESYGTNIVKRFPACAERLRGLISDFDSYADLKSNHALNLNYIAESCSDNNVCCSYWMLKNLEGNCVGSIPKAIRRRLRELGRPITVKDGVNPVQEAVDELAKALNAPRMAGLKEWVAKWFPDYRWKDVNWMSDERLKKFMDDIYYGDIPFNRVNSRILKGHLGIDEYNKFVKKFNNEE